MRCFIVSLLFTGGSLGLVVVIHSRFSERVQGILQWYSDFSVLLSFATLLLLQLQRRFFSFPLVPSHSQLTGASFMPHPGLRSRLYTLDLDP